jgi:ACR3 family arsenite transporter
MTAPTLSFHLKELHNAGLIAARRVTSVGLYIVIPVVIAQLWRRSLLSRGEEAFAAAMRRIGPWSIGALLATLVLLFAFQGEEILQQPRVIALLAVPILIQAARTAAREGHALCGTQTG